jgi:perosamine synthetase
MIPVSEPSLDGREAELLLDCVKSGFVSSDGPYVAKFEKSVADYLGLRHGVAVCNGTAAIETALFAAGIGVGDEVIMTSFTIISCASSAVRLGAIPVLVDAESDTWNMDVTQVKAAITPKTKAIMAVHIYGHPVDMDPLLKLAQEHNLIVIEDAAEVHGAEYKGRRCGSIGHIATFSFYANKIITTGEGGMVVTSDDKMAARARSYRNLCFHAERRFYHTEMGHNFRMTNLQAAIGVAQMERIEDLVAIKKKWGGRYLEHLSRIDGVRCQVQQPWAKSVFWMYCIELDARLGFSAQTVMRQLAEQGIGSRPFFLGLHEQPVFHDMGLFKGRRFPVTERISQYGLYLPSGFTLTEQKIEFVVETLGSILKSGRRD